MSKSDDLSNKSFGSKAVDSNNNSIERETPILNSLIVNRFLNIDQKSKNKKIDYLFDYHLNNNITAQNEVFSTNQAWQFSLGQKTSAKNYSDYHAFKTAHKDYQPNAPLTAPIKAVTEHLSLTKGDSELFAREQPQPISHKNSDSSATSTPSKEIFQACKQKQEIKTKNESKTFREHENKKNNFLKNFNNEDSRQPHSAKIFINPDTGHALFSPNFIYRKKYRNIDSNCFDVHSAQKNKIQNVKEFKVSIEDNVAVCYPYTPSQSAFSESVHNEQQTSAYTFTSTLNNSHIAADFNKSSSIADFSSSHSALALNSFPSASELNSLRSAVSFVAETSANKKHLKPPRPQKCSPQNILSKSTSHNDQDSNFWNNFSKSIRRKNKKSVAIKEASPKMKRKSSSNTDLKSMPSYNSESIEDLSASASQLNKRHSFSAVEFEKLEKKEKSTTLKSGSSVASISNATSWFKKKYVSMQETKQGGRRKSISCRDLGGVDCEGWLLKKKKTTSLKKSKWKKWWCVLEKKQLRFYADMELKEVEGSICLPGLRISPAPEIKTHKFAFKAFHSGSSFHFATESREDMIRWMNKISLASLSDFSLPQFQTISGFHDDETFFSSDSSSEDFATPRRESENDRESRFCEKYSKLHCTLEQLSNRLKEREKLLEVVEQFLSQHLITPLTLKEHLSSNENVYMHDF